MVQCVTINVNGLRDVVKFENLCSLISENGYDVVALQETFWKPEFITENKKHWNGEIFYSCSDTGKQGVAFLVNKKHSKSVKEIKSFDGRFIYIQLEVDNKVVDIVNIYAPNVVNERVLFFQKVCPTIPKSDDLILLCDFNTSLSPLDRSGKHTEDKAFRILSELIFDFNIYDVWRARFPTSRVFSWRRVIENQLVQSRIDFIFISRMFTTFVKNIYYKHTAFSDHSFVVLNIDFSKIERGPGTWIFNNMLLEDDCFVSKINDLILKEKQCRLYEEDPLIWIDNLKYKIKRVSQIYAKNEKQKDKSEYFKLQNKFDKISYLAANNLKYDVNEYQEIKANLQEYEHKICKGAILRSKAYWAIEGDKNSRYFLQLEKHRQENNSIKEIETDDGKLLTKTEDILDEIQNFYKNLYSCTKNEESKMKEIGKFITSKVSDEDKDFCDNQITLEEIFKSLNGMSKNKSPGSDGLTVSFYLKFFHLFGGIFQKIFKEINEKKIMPRSMRLGLITLIYKKKGKRNKISNYRPISLLNVDYKILARIMANRLKVVLPNIISPNQTCCILGRDIADTTASLRDIIELIEKDDLEGYLIKIDQEKAFDRVDHKYLFYILEQFGFGEQFVDWIKIFYNGIRSSVKCNGFLTNYVPILNSLRQGCPISALCYVIAAEPLLQAIIKNTNIEGIKIPNSNKESKIFAHADDFTLTVNNKRSIEETFKVLNLYSLASGAKINKQKSEIMCLGTEIISENDLNSYGVQLSDDVTQILGIYMGKNSEVCDYLNWDSKIKKMKTILYFWTQRDLSLQGRATVLNSLIMSRFYYTLMVCLLPDKYKEEIRLTILNFLWQNKSNLVKYKTIVAPKHEGGLNISEINLKMKAFRLKFFKKYLDKDCQILWKSTMTYFINKIENMNIAEYIVYTCFNTSQLKILPRIYREMILAYYSVKSKVDFCIEIQHIYENPIFCNPVISSNGKALLFREFLNSGISQIKHICFEFIPGFLSHNSIVEIIQERFPDIQSPKIKEAYDKILAAIPKLWKKELHAINPLNVHKCPSLTVGSKMTEFSKTSSKFFYKLLLEDFSEKPTSERFWIQHFPSMCFRPLYQTVNLSHLPPQCVNLNYRVATNTIFTLSKLLQMNKVDSSTCLSCKSSPEDMFHLWVNCPKLDSFKSYLVDTLHNILLTDTQNPIIDYTQLILHGYMNKSKHINMYFINFILSIARLTIYKTRQIKIFDDKEIDTKRLFFYTVHKQTKY